MIRQVKSLKIKLSEVLFCVENTGSYVTNLAVTSVDLGFNLSLACPLDIKKSLGITRGKNDKIDSMRIAQYAAIHYRKLKLYVPVKETIKSLKMWLTLRERLTKDKVGMGRIIEHLSAEKQLVDNKMQITFAEKRLAELVSKIEEIEKHMVEVIKADESVKANYDLLKSIKGVGPIVAAVMLCATENFVKFDDCRKFACYCGVALFECTSGTSIQGKTETSKIANIKIKTYLTSAALSAISFDQQIRKYYLRKIEEGKHKATVVNVVRFKLIARCFAVIRRQQPYIALQKTEYKCSFS
jgi:transposase